MEEQKSESENKPAETDPITLANTAAERLEKALKEQRELLDRQEKIYAAMRLGGVTQAGQKQEEKKELSPTEYAEKVYKGEINPLA